MKITMLDKPTLRFLREKINQTLLSLGEETGLIFTAGSASFSPSNATFKVSVATISQDGKVASKEADEFTRHAELVGLKPTDLGRTFTHLGKEFVVTGLNLRSNKFPVLGENKESGKRYKFPVCRCHGTRANTLHMTHQLVKQLTIRRADVALAQVAKKPDRWIGWLNIGCIRVYFRVTQRYLDSERVSTLDLSSVAIEERFRGLGIFTDFLEKVEATARKMSRILYIENVLDKRFADFFRRRGYKEVNQGGSLSFWLAK